MNISFPVILCAIVSIVIVFGCNEILPEYSQPENLLSAEVVPLNVASDTVSYYIIDNNNPNLVFIRLDSPFNGYEIRIINTYEETIQDDADVTGTVELIWNDQPKFSAEIPVTLPAVFSQHYDPSTGLITVNPGDTIVLRVYWNFRFTSGEWAFTKQGGTDGPSFFVAPKITAYYRYHHPMYLTVKTKVKLFRSLSYIENKFQDETIVIFKGYVRSPP